MDHEKIQIIIAELEEFIQFSKENRLTKNIKDMLQAYYSLELAYHSLELDIEKIKIEIDKINIKVEKLFKI